MEPVLPLFPRLVAPDSSPALKVDDETFDYAMLTAASVAFRRSLAQAGLVPGDRIGIWAHPSLETVLAFVGAMLGGVVIVPLNPALGEKELSHILKDAEPDAIFSSTPDLDRARTPGLPVHGFSFDEDSMVAPRSFVDRDPDEPVLIVYTSGTTGAPKGAVLTSRNIATTTDGLRAAWDITADDTIVHALPLFHVHGLVVGLFGALRAGACLHYVTKFSPERVTDALSQGQTVLYAVPTMYVRIADAAEKDPNVRAGLTRARLLVSGSAALSAREHARIEALTGKRVCERYGLTETLINTAVRHDGERIPGYVGQALPGIEVTLVDDQRVPLPVRDDKTIGEVAVRGSNVFIGYLNNPEATLKVRDKDGWFYTGDLGTMAPDGNLRIVGRKATDLIKTGGFKVGAGEIEGALLEHPAVSECAVIGAPDDDLGERIVAFVVLKSGATATATELIDHVANTLAKHKRPRAIHFVSELPRNAMGKVVKPKLRTLLDELAQK